jgi:RNA polymerase sigma factor (sigma-70 family)
MAQVPLARVVQKVRRLLGAGVPGLMHDQELLLQYVRERDDLAFETLVQRHGPMVLGVCQRVLHNQADAEDAFQATFLILVRKASSLRDPARLGNWLYGVAYRVAMQACTAVRKRRTKEAQAMVCRGEPHDNWTDLRPVLDQELILRLPEKYREVILLSDLEGIQMNLAFGFSKADQKQLAELKSENQVTIEGTCIGRIATRNRKEVVCIKDCKIVAVNVTPKLQFNKHAGR